MTLFCNKEKFKDYQIYSIEFLTTNVWYVSDLPDLPRALKFGLDGKFCC